MNEQQTAEEREIRDLITAAGPRGEPAAQEVAGIKEAARREWRAMVEREGLHRRARRLRGGLTLAASALLALAVGWWWASRPPLAGPIVAGVELATGTARTGGAMTLVAGAELSAGTVVETAARSGDAPAGVALRLVGGQSLRLAADSRVRLVSARRLELTRGALYIDSGPGAAGVEVATDLGTVRDVGTQFEVRLQADAAALRLRVREGECSLEAAGAEHTAIGGEQLDRLSGDGVTRSTIAPYGAEWVWVVATAPNIRIDGRSLAAVLEEVERELGRKIRYADAELRESAATTILSGPAEGLPAAALLETMLLANSLDHQVDGGTILITRPTTRS